MTNRDGTTKLVRSRLRLLETDDALEDVAVRVNYDRLGYRTGVIRLSVDMIGVDRRVERLQARPAFVTVYEVSGTPDVFAVGKFPHELALATCLQDLLTASDVRSVSVDRVETVSRKGRRSIHRSRSVLAEWRPVVDSAAVRSVFAGFGLRQ
ncbi:Lrp/AsnC family transcriptional regulator [Natrinema salinisoli]|uniref:Lrp/AsnC family transcriptional regulator n=1 Tax=Natrinema salinisoli TaxID=2878535 RepID=UPI001CF048FF|nr:Lrp/AsnC family transcriptional regulator [Natrinema salinisoli]